MKKPRTREESVELLWVIFRLDTRRRKRPRFPTRNFYGRQNKFKKIISKRRIILRHNVNFVRVEITNKTRFRVRFIPHISFKISDSYNAGV